MSRTSRCCDILSRVSILRSERIAMMPLETMKLRSRLEIREVLSSASGEVRSKWKNWRGKGAQSHHIQRCKLVNSWWWLYRFVGWKGAYMPLRSCTLASSMALPSQFPTVELYKPGSANIGRSMRRRGKNRGKGAR